MKFTRNLDLDTKDKAEYPVGYYWVPAAIDDTDPMYLGIRYGRYKGCARKAVKVAKHSIFGFQFPDRQLFLSRWPIENMDLDEQHNLAVYSRELLPNVKFSMYNALSADGSEGRKSIRDGVRSATKVIQDSGGYQLGVGITDFVDPKEVLQHHNLWADIGVCLDIPIRTLTNPKLVEATARVLALNNDYMVSHRHPNLRLANASHGITLATRKRFLDIALETPLDSLCIASLRPPMGSRNTHHEVVPEKLVAHLLWTVLYTRKRYQHYHVLGISTPWQMAVMAKIAHKFGKTITSDSATYIKQGFNGLMIMHSSYQRLGRGGPYSLERIPCHCQSCRLFSYNQMYIDKAPTIVPHNFLSLARLGKMCNWFAQNTSGHGWIFDNIKLPTGWEHKFKASLEKGLDMIDRVSTLKDISLDYEPGGNQGGLFSKGEHFLWNVVRRYEEHYGVKIAK